jgi:hypothetical protein
MLLLAAIVGGIALVMLLAFLACCVEVLVTISYTLKVIAQNHSKRDGIWPC